MNQVSEWISKGERVSKPTNYIWNIAVPGKSISHHRRVITYRR